MLVASILAFCLSLSGVRGVAIPETSVEFGTDGTLQMIKRAMPDGHVSLELDWSPKSRFHPDYIDPETGQKRSLEKRQADLENELNDGDRKWFTDNFHFSCGIRRALSTRPEVYSTSRAIGLDLDAHEVPGWTVAGLFTLGNQLTSPKKWAKCTNVHCLSASAGAALQICPLDENKPFTYGYSISRLTLSTHLRFLASVCSNTAQGQGGWKEQFWASNFWWRPKEKEYDNLLIRAEYVNCNNFVGSVCRSVDDRSHSQCLALKKMFGINWTAPSPSKTQPFKRSEGRQEDGNGVPQEL
ncbi:hypothetical protein Dda_8864 [Drechslerella dactyloides]|uniref:Uncharacterized protein n=1 Tax=Drechslerella dactyloides TaxID=74499 RepID=A0AAD6IQ48_DREDA|nr:hypothetical protein Dda_8864 [Drechslerella dactyloides]